MNNLQLFQNPNFGEISVLTIDGKPFFPATQCAKILGYTNPQKAIRDHCKGVNETFTPSAGGSQKAKIIPEGDLYRLIARSKLPGAEKFEAWVFDEVLPSIRENGGYFNNLEEIIAKTATVVATELIKQLVPIINKAQTVPKTEYISDKPVIYRKRKQGCSVISRLSANLRNEVDDMLLSEAYTYAEIKDFLELKGVYLSITSIYRYAMNLYN